MEETKAKKQIKNIPPKTIQLLFGLFLCLISFILVMDVGYVARTLNYLFFFFFGYGCYLIYLLNICFGIYLILLSKKNIIKHKITLICGSVFAYIGILSILSLSLGRYNVTFDNFDRNFLSVFSTFYENCHLPFLFSGGHSSIGGGSVGYLIGQIFNLTNNIVLSYFLGSLLIFLGLITIFLPYLITLIKKIIKANKEKRIQLEKQFYEQNQDFSFDNIKKEASNDSKKIILKDHTSDLIKQAKMTYHEPIKKEENIVNNNQANNKQSIDNLYFNNVNYQKVGGLSRAHYYGDGRILNNDINKENLVSEMIKNEPKEEEIRPQRAEQMTFDLNIDEKENNKNVATNNQLKQEEIFTDSFFEDDKDDLNEIDLINNQNNNLNINSQISQPININARPDVMSNNTINISNEETNTADTNDNKYSHNVVFEEKEENNFKNIHTISFQRQEYTMPGLDLLEEYDNKEKENINNQQALTYMGEINEVFKDFNVGAKTTTYIIGPSVTQFAVVYEPGVSTKKVSSIIDDLSIRLGGVSARFEPIVLGKPYSGLQLPNAKMATVGFKEVLEKLPPIEEHPLAVAFGKNISGDIVYADICEFPHMLVAGTTGSGKSIYIHSVIMTLIMRNNPSDLRLVIVDPKKVEMKQYKNMPHLLCPIIDDPEKAVVALNKLCEEMESRYQAFGQYQGVTSISQYNKKRRANNQDTMPYIVVILDEYADLVDRAKDIARPVVSLAQKSRACGIHLVISTQRPSTNVINGVIKGNLPTHVALTTASSVDSITIIGEGGAEKLLGKGDMLVQSPLISRNGCVRLQSCFVQNDEISRVVDSLKRQLKTEYDSDYLDLVDHSKDEPITNMPNLNNNDNSKVDSRYEDVKKAAMAEEYFSISKIQRMFAFGFGRAGRIFNQLQQEGIVASSGNAKGCKVLVHDDSYGISVDNDSNEVSSTESINEYISNSDNSDGAY